MNAILLDGAFVGMIYGLFGLGIVVVYRGSRVINFAYGEAGMVGAFVYFDLRFGHFDQNRTLTVHDHGLWYALPIGVLVAALLGLATERLAVRPARLASRIRPSVATFAIASLLLVYGARHWGLGGRFAKPLVKGTGFRVSGLLIRPEQVLILVVTTAALVGLWALYRFGSFGLRLRATAIDPYAAGLVGINVDRTSMATWALSGALGGLSAILISPLVNFHVGFMTVLSIRGLTAAVVGGLTNPWGAFGAGVLIGMAEGFIGFKSPISGFTDFLLAGLVLVVLLVRPAGLSRSAY